MIRESLQAALSDLDALEAQHSQTVEALKSEHEIAITLVRHDLTTLQGLVTDPTRGLVGVRPCAECREPYPEWADVPSPSICPSCILLSSVGATPDPGSSGRALRHDTPHEVGVAAVIHEALRDYALLNGQAQEPEWEAAPGWMCAWRIETVRAVAGGLRDAEAEHVRWLATREAEGWKYGAAVDPMKRLAPRMLPWKALLPVEQIKYRVAVGIAIALG